MILLLACTSEDLVQLDAALSAKEDTGISDTGYANVAPVALAGMGATGAVGDTLSFDATASYDPNADDMTYRWRFDVVPNGSDLTAGDLSGRYTATPSFVPDAEGTYQLEVRVMDHELDSTDTTTAVVSGGVSNGVPVIDTTGSPTRVGYGEYINLLADRSYDPDGDSLSFSWSFASLPSDSALTDSDWDDPSTDHGSFAPDVDGRYRCQLELSDGTDTATAILSVRVDADQADNAPVLDLSYDPDASVGDTVAVDASNSYDPEGETLGFRWSFVEVPSSSALTDADISGRRSDSPSFSPDAAGDYALHVEAEDGVNTRSHRAYFTVVGPGGLSPVADAAADQDEVPLGSEIYADGSGSYDPEGESISKQWSLVSVPADSSLTNSDLAKPKSPICTFEPDVAGDYTLRLVVSDGYASHLDTVTFTVTE